VVLVTGAAGSIGSELCRQILRFRPRSLLALDNNETGLYELDLELQRHGPTPLQLIMADVTDRRKVTRVFRQFRPQIVFHAAAYKHVPLLETCVDEALRVNVLGTIIVSEAAREYQAERLVFISTDKAVNPCSVMGASKRIGELWIRAVSRGSDTVFTSVRFGNVMGSRGSVVPTFAQQIEMGGPVTVTHPDMARFFMSIPEAVSLVLQAAALATGNEIFMLEMGDEVSIMELARRMIRLRGLRVNKDIEVTFTGIRPGEKLHEELVYAQEDVEETDHPLIYRLKRSDDALDCETLSSAVSILIEDLHRDGMEQQARDRLLQISCSSVERLVNQAVAWDLAARLPSTDELPSMPLSGD
jgi:FlaA1/EpsC-like NDP-sugar epimerase